MRVARPARGPGAPVRIRDRDGLPQCGELVIAPARVVKLGVSPPLGTLDELIGQQPFDGGVESPRAQDDRLGGTPFDLLDDRVAMTLAVGEGEEDMKYRRAEWQKSAGIATHGLPLCQVSRTTP